MSLRMRSPPFLGRRAPPPLCKVVVAIVGCVVVAVFMVPAVAVVSGVAVAVIGIALVARIVAAASDVAVVNCSNSSNANVQRRHRMVVVQLLLRSRMHVRDTRAPTDAHRRPQMPVDAYTDAHASAT